MLSVILLANVLHVSVEESAVFSVRTCPADVAEAPEGEAALGSDIWQGAGAGTLLVPQDFGWTPSYCWCEFAFQWMEKKPEEAFISR